MLGYEPEKERLKKKLRQQRYEARMQARLNAPKRPIAAWKIAVPVIVVLNWQILVSMNRYIDSRKEIPVWKIAIRGSVYSTSLRPGYLQTIRKIDGLLKQKGKKKEYRCTPTFVNLKSNTMKNTVQRYALSVNLQIKQIKKRV